MADAVVTRAAAGDVPALRALWVSAFGDPPELIDAFFARFPPETSAWVVRRGPVICSAAYLLTGNHLVQGQRVRPAAYVYAVASPETERGKGYAGRLMRRFVTLADEQGLLLYTRPAEPSLFAWYAACMEAVHVGRGHEETVARCEDSPLLAFSEADAAQYGQLREAQLADRPHLAFSEAFLSLQAVYCRACGAGLYAIGSGCCAAETAENTLILKELLVPEAERAAAVQTLLQHFRLSAASVRGQGAGGALPLTAFRAETSLDGINWGLFLD